MILRAAILAIAVIATPASARDDGRWANAALKQWFEQLRSGKGLCCAEADGEETEYDIRDGAYYAPIDGVMTRVPNEALLTGPNLKGSAMKWLYMENGTKTFRCFMPGAGM